MAGRSVSSKIFRVEGRPSTWAVVSSTREDVVYLVSFSLRDGWKCTCPGFQYRGHCKHVRAVQDLLSVASASG